jgi:hypothetical protein
MSRADGFEPARWFSAGTPRPHGASPNLRAGQARNPAQPAYFFYSFKSKAFIVGGLSPLTYFRIFFPTQILRTLASFLSTQIQYPFSLLRRNMR